MATQQLSDRSYHLLNKLVDRYISDGVPVGSKTLAQDASIDLSAATIRNVMSDLENRGLLTSPHTSAGRIPTAQGYRLFVDSMVTAQSVSPESKELLEKEVLDAMRNQLAVPGAQANLAECTSGILSDMTQQAGLVMLPRQESMSFRQVEFMPLSDKRVLAILVLNEQEVQNCIIQTDSEYSEEELQQASAFINRHYAGKSVEEVTQDLVESMHNDKSLIDGLMQAAMDFASQALQEVKKPDNDYVVAGQANLLDDTHVDNMHRLKDLFEAFQQKKDILHLMQRCVSGQGVQVYIGAESGFEVLDDFSVVTAPYHVSSQTVGVLAVIGPTRMAYSKVVPMVDVTAKLLAAALKN